MAWEYYLRRLWLASRHNWLTAARRMMFLSKETSPRPEPQITLLINTSPAASAEKAPEEMAAQKKAPEEIAVTGCECSV